MTPKPDDAKLSLAERIESIADAITIATPPPKEADELRAIAEELMEISGELTQSQGTGGFSGLTERFTLQLAERLAKPTPDLTEALARLKALGEEAADQEPGTSCPCRCCKLRRKWADEIAAIRKTMGARE